MNQQLVQAIQAEIAQSRAEGMDAEDVLWMACGAGLSHARDQGVIEEEASPEMLAAIEAVVKQELANQ